MKQAPAVFYAAKTHVGGAAARRPPLSKEEEKLHLFLFLLLLVRGGLTLSFALLFALLLALLVFFPLFFLGLLGGRGGRRRRGLGEAKAAEGQGNQTDHEQLEHAF